MDYNLCGKRGFVLLRAYIDDSQDGKAEHFVHMTAAIGSEKQWKQVSESWKKVLKSAPKIGYFKSRECRNLDKEFAPLRNLPPGEGRQVASEKQAELKSIIDRSELGILGCAIPISAYEHFRSLDHAASKFFCEDPVEQALHGILMTLCKNVVAQKNTYCISFVYDKDTNRERRFSELYKSFQESNPNWAKVTRSFSQLNDELWPGLQVADLLANLATNELRTLLPEWDGSTPKTSKSRELEKYFKGFTVYHEKFLAEVLINNGGPDLRSKIRHGNEQFQVIARPKKRPQFRRAPMPPNSG